MRVKLNTPFMDSAILNSVVLSQYTGIMSTDGSRVVAQAPISPTDGEVLFKQGPRPEVWETHRLTIKRLYLDEDMTLKDVMATMQRKHGLGATVKMYKHRIKKWGFDKNCKASEMQAIARKKLERDAIGKASSFRIRGRQIEFEEVRRRFRRKPHHLLETVVVREKYLRSATPSEIKVLTPEPSIPSPSSNDAHFVDSAPMTVAERGFTPSHQKPGNFRVKKDPAHLSSDLVRRQSLWVNNNLRRLSSLGRMSPLLEPPRHLAIPERLFLGIKTLLECSWDRDLWSTNERGYLVSRKEAHGSRPAKKAIFSFLDYSVTAMCLFKRKMFVEARQLLFKACETCDDIVEEEHARTIPIIFLVYSRLAREGYGDAAIKVLEHLKSVAMMTTSRTPAFGQLMESLLLADQNVEEVYFTTWRCSEDIFERHLETFHRTWLESHLDYIEQIDLRSGWRAAESLLRPLLTQCEQLCGRSDPRCQEILYKLAWNLFFQGKFDEAEKLGQTILRYASRSLSDGTDATWTLRALHIISAAQYSQSKNDQAEDSLRRCIDLAANFYGEQDPTTVRRSLRLEKWLLSWGRREEASTLAAQRARILGPAEMEELIE